MNKNDFYKGLFWGTLIGAGIGTAMGILFAPRKGEETRRALFESLNASLNPKEEPPSEMPVPNSIPPKEGAVPADVENEAKRRAEEIIDEARLEAQRLLREANALLREAERANRDKRNGA
ncbi:MAG: YtxH domain-containing protein [Chloroherpetonaceae bacterium]|nr:YtxH domain-containing protein [Chloroherpetonaceae bacterium]MDW8437219.1 YtxH domain-containing protein [Chloroherpetonaceae bacterium]